MSRTSLLPFALVLTLIGCGSDDEPAVATDTGVDAVVDTAKVPDTTPPPSCESELSSNFECVAPIKVAGETTCSEEALQGLIESCLAADITVPSECAAWKAANAACATCVRRWHWTAIPGEIYPDDYKCYWAIMDDTCAKNVNCMFDCQDEVCAECDRARDSDGTSEIGRCYSANEQAGSKCWDVAAQAGMACFQSHDTAGCNVNEIYKDTADLTTLKSQVLRFLRGACRDNGDWTRSEEAGDAGVDSGETGADTAMDDAADTTVDDAADTTVDDTAAEDGSDAD
jgi:hypothetical protein